MNVEQLMKRTAKTCGPQDALLIPARIMWVADIGSVPVVDDSGKALAMITDRDICMAALHTGQGARSD